MHTPSSLLKLRQKLTSLGMGTLELLKFQKKQSFAEIISNLCGTLLQLKGEASSVAIAEEILLLFNRASDDNKKLFFRYLHAELRADTDSVNQAITDYQALGSQLTLHNLALASEPLRMELFRTLNTAPEGTMALIAMREDLHRLMAQEPEFTLLDQELLSLFRAWFNRGFLELRRIDWQTPALILEKLIQYESVHAITGWADLRRRLERDRFCYGFFHPAIVDVPLIFVEVALTNSMSSNIGNLLQQAPPGAEALDADTAVFYSINNCLLGLRGVSFGNFLIKQVVDHLTAVRSDISNFVTLSPVPGFMNWLKAVDKVDTLLNTDEAQAINALLTASSMRSVVNSNGVLYKVLPRLCAYYLVNAKSRAKPADPVARFHLGNGARLERVNWMADSSDHGLLQSAGLMVNYVYDKQTLARNHEAYEHQNKVIFSSGIQQLLS